MSDIVMLHRQALDATRRMIANVGEDQWNQPSPCDGWNVRELVNHVVTGNFWAAELAAGKSIADVGDRLDGDVLGSDPLHAYDRSADIAADAFGREGALQAPCAVSYGPVPGEVYAGHRFVDVLVHGWDLAKATGQSTTLDSDLVDAALDVIAPQLANLQASGEFGSPVTVSKHADPEVKLLAMLGRTP